MESKLSEAASKGSVKTVQEIIEADKGVCFRIVEEHFNWSPLHVAASRGHVEIVKQLVRRNPELAEVLDSRQRSPLHLASANGHVEVVRQLILARRDMCFARDRDGLNPLHIAAIHGCVEVLKLLIKARPLAVRVRIEHDQTILHLCVRHSQLHTLDVLLKHPIIHELLAAKDDNGNTILHLAVAAKEDKIVNSLLSSGLVDVYAINANGYTAMDIHTVAKTNADWLDMKTETIDRYLKMLKAERGNNLMARGLEKIRDPLVVMASFAVTISVQVALNPPGGVWDNNSDGHTAGEAIMADNHPELFHHLHRANLVGFIASVITIFFLITGLPFKKNTFAWILVVLLWSTITSLAYTFAISALVVTRKLFRESLGSKSIAVMVAWYACLAFVPLALLLRTIWHLVRKLQNGRRDLMVCSPFSAPLHVFYTPLPNLDGIH